MTTTTTTCPSWCAKHPASGEGTHQSETWQGPGLTMSIEHSAEDGVEVYVDHNPDEYLALTPEQARALGLELIRAAEQVQWSV